jgi:hypothetical protein
VTLLDESKKNAESMKQRVKIAEKQRKNSPKI